MAQIKRDIGMHQDVSSVSAVQFGRDAREVAALLTSYICCLFFSCADAPPRLDKSLNKTHRGDGWCNG